jgi:retinol dehydrogenase 12
MKVAFITGANTGIGRVTARELARQGMHVFVACRSLEKARPVVAEIIEQTGNPNVELLELDLADFASVRACAETFLARGLPLHLLINNGGLAGARGFTKSGFELAFGVNHMGHFLLTQLLLERIKQSAPARIVTVASRAHTRVSGIDWDAVRKKTATPAALKEYGVSKLANVLFSAELARRLEGTGVTTYALHPGVVATDVWRSVPWPFDHMIKLFMISIEEGALTTLHCALSEQAGQETGLYYDKQQPRPASKLGQDAALAKELWARSEAWSA